MPVPLFAVTFPFPPLLFSFPKGIHMDKYGVIFDMDGVLVNSYQAHFQSWRETARKRGLDMTEQQFAETFGRTSRDIIRHLWPDYAAEADIPAWDTEKEAEYRRIIHDDFPEMDGADQLLRKLHQSGFALAIGSSGPPKNVNVVLECLPSGGLISAAVDGSQVTHGKPHPEVFLLAAEKLDIAPHLCAVIEDAPAGLQAAHRAGMAAIGITGTAPRQKLSAAADEVVVSLRELSPDKIARIIRRRRQT